MSMVLGMLQPRRNHLCRPYGGRKGRHTAARNARAARKNRKRR